MWYILLDAIYFTLCFTRNKTLSSVENSFLWLLVIVMHIFWLFVASVEKLAVCRLMSGFNSEILTKCMLNLQIYYFPFYISLTWDFVLNLKIFFRIIWIYLDIFVLLANYSTYWLFSSSNYIFHTWNNIFFKYIWSFTISFCCLLFLWLHKDLL